MNMPIQRQDQKIEEGLSTPVGTRRTFFNWMIGTAFGIIGLGLTIPLLGYVISPSLKRKKTEWQPVGQINDLLIDEPKDLECAMTVKDGWRETKTIKAVWAIRQADNQVMVFSPICTHLGCGYRWDTQDRQFKCPCHNSVFDLTGNVVSGPAPRPLDPLPTKIENGHLLVQYKEFKSGIQKKVEL